MSENNNALQDVSNIYANVVKCGANTFDQLLQPFVSY